MKQTFVLDQPPTLNKLIAACRNNKYGAATIKKKWTNYSCRKAIADELVPFEGKVYLIATGQYKTTASDPDNIMVCLKYILDGLVKADVIKDDTVKTVKNPILFRVEPSPSIKVNGKKKRAEPVFKLEIFDNTEEFKLQCIHYLNQDTNDN